MSFFLRNLPVHAFDSRAKGFSPPLARRRSSCPPPSLNLVRTHPIEHYQALCDSAPCLSHAAIPPERHQIGARKRRAPGNTILSQPYRRRVSTDRLIAKAASWLHLLRVSPALHHPPERLPHSIVKPTLICRYFQHAHFIPIVGVGKRGRY